MNSIIIMLREKRAELTKKIEEAVSRLERQQAALRGCESEVAERRAELAKIDDAIGVLIQTLEQRKAVRQ